MYISYMIIMKYIFTTFGNLKQKLPSFALATILTHVQVYHYMLYGEYYP